MDISQAFGQVLRQSRVKKGMTHELLAERAGLHPTTLSLLERGKRQPSLTTLMLLADALSVPAEELVVAVKKLRPKLGK